MSQGSASVFTAASVWKDGGYDRKALPAESAHWQQSRHPRPFLHRLTMNQELSKQVKGLHHVLSFRGGHEQGQDNKFTADTTQSALEDDFLLLHQERVWDSWRTVTRRTVRLPRSSHHAFTGNPQEAQFIDFEVVGQKGVDAAVLVFVWHRESQTASLIREYMPSTHSFQITLCAGMVEGKDNALHGANDETIDADSLPLAISRHDKLLPHVSDSSFEQAARRELAEEGRMVGGTWICLCESTPVDKYITTVMRVYLCIDPEPLSAHEEATLLRDESEVGMQVVQKTAGEIESAIQSGDMTVVAGWAAQLALNKLRELGEI
jgi:8-oxo-dGTP pyrophosphatase MutT (NUDIX family)